VRTADGFTLTGVLDDPNALYPFEELEDGFL
jgi:hypothetical protein